MLKELLTALKMKGALASLDHLFKIKDKNQFVIALLQSEYDHKQHQSMKRRLSQAKFPVEKDWSDIDNSLNPSIDFDGVKKLGTGEFIAKHQNICVLGQQGTGKTHSLIALGRRLCKEGITVKFYTACTLVNMLEEAKVQHELSKVMQMLLKPQLLIIDELGFVPFSENGARLLFDVFASRYERRSIAVSTNLSFEKWGQIFGSVELTAALVDRFTHNAIIFIYEGQSIRLLNTKKKRKKKGNII